MGVACDCYTYIIAPGCVPVKICLVSPGLAPVTAIGHVDATNTVIRSLGEQLAARGNDVDIISSGDGEEQSWGRCRVFDIPVPEPLSGKPLLRQAYYSTALRKALPALAKANGYDVVHFHSPAGARFGSLGLKKMRIPTVYTSHNPNLGYDKPVASRNKLALARKLNTSRLPYINSLCSMYAEAAAFKTVGRVIALSEISRANIARYFGVDPNRIDCIPNGVDVDRFCPQVACTPLAAEAGLTVLCVARIAPYKNQLVLLQAFDRLRDRYTDMKLILAGPVAPPFLDYHACIRDYINGHDLSNRVQITGAVDEQCLTAYYTLADIFVLPSLTEGMPLVLLEAMGCGKAIVASAIPQNQEVAKNGDIFLLANPLDPGDIAAQIDRLAGDAGLRATLAIEARKIAHQHYSWPKIALRTIEVYESMIV